MKHRQIIMAFVLGIVATAVGAAELKLLLPLGRVAYQTNERIDLAAVRSANGAPLAAGELTLTLKGEADGSALQFVFPVRAAAVDAAGAARATEHLHLNGAFLRPGRYTVTVASDGATATTALEVYNHVRKSNFVIGDWPQAGPGDRLNVMGEDSLGFNLTFRTTGLGDATIRGGLDYMRGMALGGAHQLDANLKADWSDPWVLREGRLRASRQALRDRTQPNCVGVHFYDEPGLTWNEHPETKMFGPYNIAAQDRAWQGSYGEPAQQYHKVAATDPASVDRWRQMNLWKLRFMEAAWRHISTGVNLVRPDWLTATQTQYGWDAFSDGYYFNIARRLPVIIGHGWYSDCYWLNLAPPMASEFGRVRDWNRPAWYLPTWWDMNLAHARLEQAMSFAQNLQGMFWPTPAPWAPSSTKGMEGIVEMNRLMLRLGPVFTTMPVDRAPVALLYSVSQGIDAQIRSGMKDFRYANQHLRTTEAFYAAGMCNQVPLFPVVEEDILDGTVAAHHRAIILSKVEYLPPAVIGALEDCAAAGGKVLLDNECTVAIQGAEKLGLQVDHDFHNRMQSAPGNPNRAIYTSHNFMKNTAPLARDLRQKLAGYGIQPVFTCDSTDILGRRQAHGDIEYLFAVNLRTDPEIEWQNNVRGTTATIGLPDDGRPVYDAILGGEARAFTRQGKELQAAYRFGPGQMRIWGRTARPIGGVAILAAEVRREYVDAPQAPVTLELAASLLDTQGRVLAGSAPLRVRVIDPLGDVRYELYRATADGRLRLSLPLAATDADGEWRVEVADLLAGQTGQRAFRVTQPRTAGAVAGMTHRAVMFGDDADRAYDFFRRHRDVLLVTGSSPYNAPAAAHLAENLKPWGVTCEVVPAADVKPRTVPAAANAISLHWEEGFNVAKPCVLLGTPADNPLIKFMVDGARTAMLPPSNMLPYRPVADTFPGRGRGLVMWQLDVVAHDIESLACVADDAAGMMEAVGSLFEAVSGLAPLTAWALPSHSGITPATAKRQAPPALAVAWSAQVPDRAVGMTALADGRVVVLSYDGTVTLFDAAGKRAWEKTTDHSGEFMAFAAGPNGRLIAVGAGVHVVAFDAEGRQLFDVSLTKEQTPNFVRSLAVAADSETVFAGTGDGRVVALDRKGQARWEFNDPRTAAYWKAVADYQQALAAWVKAKGPADKQPVPPGAAALVTYSRLVLAADGATLLAATHGDGQLLATADGTVLGNVPGLSAGFPIVADGAGFLAYDGRSGLLAVSAAEKKIVRSIPVPGTQVVALTRQGDGWLYGTESDSTVRRTGALPENATAAWAHQDGTHIVKSVLAAGDRSVVVYWGGLTRVLDAKGAVKAEQLFPQDFSATTMAGQRLCGVTADGRVVAADVP